MRIAAQLYTVRDFLKTPEEIFDTLKKVKQIGYDVIQVSGMGAIEPALLKSYVDELGLEICGTHMPFDRIVNDTESLIKEHKLLNCPYIGLGAAPDQFRNADGYKKFAEIMEKPAKMISDAGLKFTYHNHEFEFKKFGNQTGMDILLDNTNSETFKLLPDIYWLQAGGVVPSAFLKKHANRIEFVHYKDMVLTDDGQQITEVGNGNIDWVYINDVCLDIGIKYAAVEQDYNWSDGNAINSLETSYKYLKDCRII